ncbi:Heat shock protein 16 [Grifola frondosa]|uniref:Heat shock protein 16 n=1 Tax=Grifola frondosa TaxID=5627 RepID=A0A1C7MIN3_GRIFR|nr:Heat shock protein 16 [Grifola frondosa]
MSLVTFFNEPIDCLSDFDRLFDEAFNRTAGNNGRHQIQCHTTCGNGLHRSLRPTIDVHEDAEKNVITATFELPGIKKEDVNIDVHNNVLTVSGASELSSDHDEHGYVVRERRYGKFSRALRLPQGIKAEEIKAGMENGVLTSPSNPRIRAGQLAGLKSSSNFVFIAPKMSKDQSLLYLDSIQPLLPDVLNRSLEQCTRWRGCHRHYASPCCGSRCSVNGRACNLGSMQANALKTIDDLKRGDTPSSNKRSREDDALTQKARKRQRYRRGRSSTRSPVLEDDPPLFTLHTLSATTPVRKKVDITVHSASIRLTNPNSHALEHPSIPFSSLRRAFLLPTRGKTKPHWTVVLLPSDTPSPPASLV